MSCSVSAAAIETLNHWLTKVFKSAELASPEQIVRIINNMIGENRGAVRWQDPWCDHRYLYDRMVTVQQLRYPINSRLTRWRLTV